MQGDEIGDEEIGMEGDEIGDEEIGMQGNEIGDEEIGMQEDEIRNAGTDGIGWTERVAFWQTVNWPEQKIVRKLEGRMRSGNCVCMGG